MAEPSEVEDLFDSTVDETTVVPTEGTTIGEAVESASVIPAEVHATSEVSPTPAQQLSQTPKEVVPSAEELTPRERLLLERLEQVTGERLERTPVQSADVPTIKEHNFLEGADLDEVLSTPENFNKLLMKVYQLGVQESREHSLRFVDDRITQKVTSHTAMVEAVRDFYDSNPDLRAVKRTVAAVADEITASEPTLPLDDVFSKAATKTRELLGLRKPEGNLNGVSKPSFVRSTHSRQSGSREPQLQGIVKEIDDLLKDA